MAKDKLPELTDDPIVGDYPDEATQNFLAKLFSQNKPGKQPTPVSNRPVGKVILKAAGAVKVEVGAESLDGKIKGEAKAPMPLGKFSHATDFLVTSVRVFHRLDLRE